MHAFAYLGAALAEIAGCFAFWAWLRLGKSVLWLVPGLASLVAFAWLLTVAITEKLANVEMTASVLAHHPRIDPGVVLGTDVATTVLMLGAVEVPQEAFMAVLKLRE